MNTNKMFYCKESSNAVLLRKKCYELGLYFSGVLKIEARTVNGKPGIFIVRGEKGRLDYMEDANISFKFRDTKFMCIKYSFCLGKCVHEFACTRNSIRSDLTTCTSVTPTSLIT